MTTEMTGIIGILVLLCLLVLRVYIGIALTVVGFLGFGYLYGFSASFSILGMTPFGTTSTYALSVIPLFLLMGQFSFHSGMSRDIYNAVDKWLGHFPGGLAIATILGCAGFSAICGSSLATAATIGRVAMPEMEKYDYDSRLSTGAIAAGGTLGILIPPSIGFVIYGILTEESIGKLFLAGILPGLLLTLLYIGTIIVLCWHWPALAPPGEKKSIQKRLKALFCAWPMIILFTLVLGGIYLGIFTPIEAGGIGAFVAFIISTVQRRLSGQVILLCLKETLKTTSMIFLILIGADIFNLFLCGSKLPFFLSDWISTLTINKYIILTVILVSYTLLGCILDGIAMIILTIPILFPVIIELGFDPVWFGVLVVITLEMGLITPPIGMNVFIIKGVVGNVKLETIFAGVIPFVIACILAILLIIFFPQLALVIPAAMS